MAIDVHLKNDGPPLTVSRGLPAAPRTDPLRDAGSRHHPVGPDAPPVRPAAGLREHDAEVSLVDGATTIATTKASYAIHDGTQMVVGIVAERPGDIIGDLDLLPNMNNVRPLTVGLEPGDLQIASRHGARSIGWSGRTSIRISSRRSSSSRSRLESPVAVVW